MDMQWTERAERGNAPSESPSVPNVRSPGFFPNENTRAGLSVCHASRQYFVFSDTQLFEIMSDRDSRSHSCSVTGGDAVAGFRRQSEKLHGLRQPGRLILQSGGGR